MKFDVLTLFPEMYDVFNHSIIKRASDNGIIEINIHDIRDYTSDKHKKVDDYPYGGGMGMVMQAEPVYNSIEAVTEKIGYKPYTIFLSPRGQRYDQSLARKFAAYGHLLLICGHYEGVDERVMNLVDSEVSMGDFVLTGGELASMIIVDSVSRLIPGVLSSDECYEDESFYSGLLEYPQYTRPANFRGMEVPEILLSGHHENIRKWRRYQSLKLTYERRPDLLEKFILNKEDRKLLDKIKGEK